MRGKLICALTLSALGTAIISTPAATAAQPAIIDGSYAESGPWAAMVERDGQQWCSGSIIAARWVLTANHCVDDDAAYSVRVGSVDHTKGAFSRVHRVHPHPSADIALLELDLFVVTQYANIDGSVRAGDTVQAYGWGQDQHGEMQTRLKVASLKATSVSGGTIRADRIDGMVSHGDSGGPAFVDGRQVGVHVAVAGNSSFHTHVGTYRGWIRSTSGV